MKHSAVHLLLAVCLILTAASVQAQDLIVNSPITIDVPSTFDNVTVKAGGILTADAEITVIGKMVVEAGGIVTHSLRLVEGVRLNVGDSLKIESGGKIDVSGKGYVGGIGGASDSTRLGEGSNGSAPMPARSTPPYSGGSHGGVGGYSPSPLYDDELNPTLPGAGGGGGDLPGENGGAGGGVVKITASTLQLDGEIKADGESGASSGCSGGAGGAIQIDVNDLAGAGGVRAQGGQAGDGPSGAGGGGRIKIFSNSNDFELIPSAAGGTNNAGGTGFAGSAGTQYLKNNAEPFGRLILDNNNITDANNTRVTLLGELGPRTFKTVEIRNEGALYVTDSVFLLQATDSLIVHGSGHLFIESGASINAPNVKISSGNVTNAGLWMTGPGYSLLMDGTSQLLNEPFGVIDLEHFDGSNFVSGAFTNNGELNIASDSIVVASGMTLTLSETCLVTGDNTLTALHIFGTLQADVLLTILDDLVVHLDGIVTHAQRLLEGLRLNVGDRLVIESGGRIDVTGKGYRGGTGGASDSTRLGEGAKGLAPEGVRSTPPYSGGSHGGVGGYNPSPTYGSELNPILPGAGGGGGDLPGENGGAGGGVVKITASTLELDGEIKADGESGASSGCSGGAGGAIQIDVNDLVGAGGVRAQGGQAGDGPSGAGGGGRIKIFSNADEFDLTPNSAGGTNNAGGTGFAGSAGTQYFKNNAEPFGRLILDNNNITDANNIEVYLDGTLGPRTFKDVTVTNHGSLVVQPDIQPFEVTGQLLSGTGGRLSFEGSHILSQGTLALDNGEVSASGSIRVEGAGIVTGNGTITAILENDGHVGSGSSSGELKVVGDYIQTSLGSLNIGIRGTTALSDYNRLAVYGNAYLDGALEVSFLDGFLPSEPDTFSILKYGSYAGVFTDYLGFDPSQLIPTYDDTSLVLTHVPVSCCVVRGDFNQNGQVDILDIDDFINWLFRSGLEPGCQEEADVDGNDQSDILDIDYLIDWLFRGGTDPVPCE